VSKAIIERDSNGRYKKGSSGNPKGRPPGSVSLNTRLIEAMDEQVVVKLRDGITVETSPSELMAKMLARAIASGKLELEGRTIALSQSDWMQIAAMIFKQISPAPSKVDVSVSEGVERMSDEELLREFMEEFGGAGIEGFDGFDEEG